MLQQQQYPESLPGISPSTLYEDFNSNTDFNSDSAGTPVSHYSPALSASSFNLSIPAFGDEFFHWDAGKFERPSELEDCFKPEPYDGSIISTLPPRPLPASPAINPVELSLQGATTAQDLTFNLEGINTDAPLFQSQMGVTLPPQRQIPFPLLVQQQPQPQQQQPIELAEDVKRYPPRLNLKRKSSYASSSSEEEHRLVKRPSPSPPPASSHGPPTRKEKDASSSTSAPKKTAHNMIEKRYRTNLNDKINALRDSVPALRLAVLRQETGNYDEGGIEGEEGDYNNMIPAPKLNKATILSKATEYIGTLDRRCRVLETENNALRGRVAGLEMLLIRQGHMGAPDPSGCGWN